MARCEISDNACLFLWTPDFISKHMYLQNALRYVRLHGIKSLDSTGCPTVVSYQYQMWKSITGKRSTKKVMGQQEEIKKIVENKKQKRCVYEIA